MVGDTCSHFLKKIKESQCPWYTYDNRPQFSNSQLSQVHINKNLKAKPFNTMNLAKKLQINKKNHNKTSRRKKTQ